MHIFRRDKRDEKDIEAVDFFKQVAQWRAPASQPPPAQQPAPQGPPPAQPAPAPTQGPAAPPQPVAQPQAAPAPRLAAKAKSPFEELLELGKILNIDLRPLEELRNFAQRLDSEIAELEKEATQLENQAKERRRAADLLRQFLEQLRTVGV